MTDKSASKKISMAVIGDDTDSINKIVGILNKPENNVHVAGVAMSFESGYEIIHKKKPKIVIVDACSEGKGACIEKIKGLLGKFPQIFVFVVSEDNSAEAILDYMRAGVTEYILKPVTEVDLCSALLKFSKRLPIAIETETEKAGRVYSIFSAKNGVGVTTIAVNLATNIYEITKKPTVIVDLDLVGGDVATFLNVKPSYTISDVTGNIRKLDESFLRGVITKHDSGVFVLAEPRDVDEGISISAPDVKKMLEILKTMFDYIIIDTEPNLTQVTRTAIEISDMILFTFVLSLPSIKNSKRYLDYLNRIGIKNSKVGLVLNRYMKNAEITLEDAARILNQSVFCCLPNDFNTAMACLNKGIPLSSYDSNSKLKSALRELAVKMIGDGEWQDSTSASAKTSVLDKVVRNISRLYPGKGIL